MGLGNLALLARLAGQVSGMGNAYELGKQSEEDRQYAIRQRERAEADRLLGNQMKQEELGLRGRQVATEEERTRLAGEQARQQGSLNEFSIKKMEDERKAADLKKWYKQEMKPTAIAGVNLYDRGDANGDLETIVVDNEGNRLPVDADTAIRAAEIYESEGENLLPEDGKTADFLLKSGVASPRTRAKIHKAFGWLSIPENERASLNKDAEAQYEKDFKPLIDNYELSSRLLSQYADARKAGKADPYAGLQDTPGIQKPDTLQGINEWKTQLENMRAALDKAGSSVADFKRDKKKILNEYMRQAFEVKYAPDTDMGNKPGGEPAPGVGDPLPAPGVGKPPPALPGKTEPQSAVLEGNAVKPNKWDTWKPEGGWTPKLRYEVDKRSLETKLENTLPKLSVEDQKRIEGGLEYLALSEKDKSRYPGKALDLGFVRQKLGLTDEQMRDAGFMKTVLTKVEENRQARIEAQRESMFGSGIGGFN